MTVLVLTYCRSIEALYGSTLVFSTLRIGFPTANILVVDNGSIPEALLEIQKIANAYGFNVLSLKPEHYVAQYMRFISAFPGQVVICDPDIIFWSSIEGFNTSNHLALGRLIPAFHDPYTRCHTMPRLHTSLFWIPDSVAFLGTLTELRKYFDCSPLYPAMIPINDTWQRWDTFAIWYAAFHSKTRAFSEAELDCYDHIMCGSHGEAVASRIPALQKVHKDAKSGNILRLRGIWREQEEFFRSMT